MPERIKGDKLGQVTKGGLHDFPVVVITNLSDSRGEASVAKKIPRTMSDAEWASDQPNWD